MVPRWSWMLALEATPLGHEWRGESGSENSALASGVLLCRVWWAALAQTGVEASVVSSLPLVVLGSSKSEPSLSKLLSGPWLWKPPS
jgi:hypothetical protein